MQYLNCAPFVGTWFIGDSISRPWGHAPEPIRGVSLELFLASFGVPVHDVRAQLSPERVGRPAGMELVL